MIAKGEPWGSEPGGPPEIEVRGTDADLARAITGREGARVRFIPDEASDIARSVGLDGVREPTIELPMDALRVNGVLAVNMVVAGAARPWARARPVVVTIDGTERFRGIAKTVVIATGEFLRGVDVVSRGHPGDGRIEVRVADRQFSGTAVNVAWKRRCAVEIDGVKTGRRAEVTVEVVPAAYRLLV